MSNTKINPSAFQEGKGKTPQAMRQAFIAERTMAIVEKFNSVLEPTETSDFRDIIFRCLHDAYIHKDGNSVFTEQNLSTMYYLWEILDEIDCLRDIHGFPEEHVNKNL